MMRWIALGLAPLGLYTQWSGIINSYTQVTNISGSNLTVSSSAGFGVGDRVLLIQMKGGSVNLADGESYGDITSIDQVGRYELNTISGISGNTITLGCAPSFPYNTTSGRVQLVRVAHAPNATVVGTVTAPAWDGYTGGVVAIEVPGTLTLNAPISVDFLGYRGGPVPTMTSPGCTSNLDIWGADATSTYGGVKGEGIVITPAAHTACRGKMANGGGGGNNHNRGGGGGGNHGTGGRGGCTAASSTCGSCIAFPEFGQCTNARSGRGGASLSGFIGGSRLFMGGGGGSGDQNNNQGGRGGHGGGIILIMAGTLQGNGQTLSARGENAPLQFTTATEDGVGGGGAGGCVALFYNTFTGPLTVDVRGGNGANVIGTFQTARDYGPGGGGGGGYLLLSDLFVPPGLTVQTAGGTAGIETKLDCSNFPAQRAATDGTNGATLIEASLPLSCPLSWHIDFHLRTTLRHAYLSWEIQTPESLQALWLEIQNLEKPYHELISVAPKGKYTFYAPYEGEWHLRLWATHADGKKSMLRQHTVRFSFPEMPKILYYDGIPHLILPRPQRVELITSTGQQLWQKELPAGTYAPTQLNLPPGFYLLKTEENTLTLSWRP
ncbi:MAG: hypothetical protein ACUVRD_07545 [Bacteroidia bacterium]